MNSAELKVSLFKSAVAKVKQAFADMSEEECNALIEEAIKWARTDTICEHVPFNERRTLKQSLAIKIGLSSNH